MIAISDIDIFARDYLHATDRYSCREPESQLFYDETVIGIRDSH
jgi:hypothetical protein